MEGSTSTAAGVSQHLSPTKIKGRGDRVRSPPSLRNKLNLNQCKFLGANNRGSPPSTPEMAMTIKEPRGGLWPFLGPGPAQMAACPRGPSLGSSFPFTPRGRSPRVGESHALSQDPPGPEGKEGKGVAGRGEAGARAARDSRTGCGGAAGARPPAGQKRGLLGRKDPRSRGTSEAALGSWRTDSMVGLCSRT